jgi:hypothetical protein
MWKNVEGIAKTETVEEIISARTSKQAGGKQNYFFDPEDGDNMFLRNVGCNSTDYTASHPRR